MTLCKFFLQGNCRFGDACRFEHRAPRPNESEYNEWRRNNPSSFGGQQNTFGAASNGDNHATRKGWSEQIIFDELKTGRPQWPFTSFGAPHFRSLLSNDVSFEEYHLAAMEANRNGTFPDWQRNIDQRVAEIRQQEDNVLNNITQAWKYNENDLYYPCGKLESGNTGGALGGTQTSAFGGSQSTFGSSTGQWTLGGTSSFNKSASSFGTSPFGAMPASAFSLGSRGATSANSSSTPANTTSAFGSTTSNTTFGQPRSAFGTTSSTPSAFGSTTPSAFGAKPSTFGTSSSMPPAPTSSSLTPSQPAFGQTSTLGASGLPPPPGTGFGSKPAFGQTSGLGVLGGSSVPTFGQASSFSSPFAGGLGRALGGGSTTSTFGSKSTFGSFGQGQSSAFAQAAGMGQPNAFTQAANQPSAFATTANTGANTFDSGSRFTLLSETSGDAMNKDADMADEQPSPVQERAPAQPAAVQPSAPHSASIISPPLSAPLPKVAESSQAIPSAQSAPAPSQLAPNTTGLSVAFGSLSTKSDKESQSSAQTLAVLEKPPTGPLNPPSKSTTIVPTGSTPRPAPSTAKSTVDEMAAWRANEFVIGMIPETEPPLEVR